MHEERITETPSWNDPRGQVMKTPDNVAEMLRLRAADGELWPGAAGCGVQGMAAKTGMAAGVKPRSREAVRHLAQGFTRDDSPGDNGWWRRIL
jgi:hypothetical protein